ncbi:MAG: hypothetical protein KME64_00125 [Scytonematopsis contorta HA4267-MV1]|jgi:hypothetical protein|nr:hypothetical protein [Scytonematopsis contorta HA4267-MV1]
MSENIIAAEVLPLLKQSQQAAVTLENLGFRVLYIGQTISVEAPESLWRAIFNISFIKQQKTVMPEVGIEDITYLEAVMDDFQIPAQMRDLIADVMFVEPPELY